MIMSSGGRSSTSSSSAGGAAGKKRYRTYIPQGPPGWKQVPGTSFIIDGFKHRDPNCKHWFLTHYHSDHYGGLNKSFRHGVVYCSASTANLVTTLIGVDGAFVRSLPMYKWVQVDRCHVYLIDANHCPGSVLFLFFHIERRAFYLHCGDMRYIPRISEDVHKAFVLHKTEYPSLLIESVDHTARSLLVKPSFATDVKGGPTFLHTLYMDNTYLNPTYAFSPQDEVLQAVVEQIVRPQLVADASTSSKTLFVVGSYTIGKERVVAAIASAFGKKVYVDDRKYAILKLLELPYFDVFTTDMRKADVHFTSMFNVSYPGLVKYHGVVEDTLRSLHSEISYARVVGIRPTGWTWKGNNSKAQKQARSADASSPKISDFFAAKPKQSRPLKPKVKDTLPPKPLFTKSTSGHISVFSVPYSEHSSFAELQAFVRAMRPCRIVPTVVSYGASVSSVQGLLKHFSDCLDGDLFEHVMDRHVLSQYFRQDRAASAGPMGSTHSTKESKPQMKSFFRPVAKPVPTEEECLRKEDSDQSTAEPVVEDPSNVSDSCMEGCDKDSLSERAPDNGDPKRLRCQSAPVSAGENEDLLELFASVGDDDDPARIVATDDGDDDFVDMGVKAASYAAGAGVRSTNAPISSPPKVRSGTQQTIGQALSTARKEHAFDIDAVDVDEQKRIWENLRSGRS